MNKVVEYMLPSYKNYYKATIVQTGSYWQIIDIETRITKECTDKPTKTQSVDL